MANLFPRSANFLPFKIAICIGAAVTGIVLAVAYYGTPKTFDVGYQPAQPIAYDHALHAGMAGMDCRNCHSFADQSGQANIPTAEVCWGCHGTASEGVKGGGGIKANSPKLAALRDAVLNDKPIRWVKVYESPGYVYFNHSAHLNRGVSCVSCHGEVNKMRKVYKAKVHTMGFCIDCHNAPEDHLRPVEKVADLTYSAKDYLFKAENENILARVKAYHTAQAAKGKKSVDFDKNSSNDKVQKAFGLMLKDHHNVMPKTSCQTCHN